MGAYQGALLSVAELLDGSDMPVELLRPSGSTAATNMRVCERLLADGASLRDCWRFGIMQTISDYTTCLNYGGTELAASVFTNEPSLLPALQLNAAIAALAEWLAHRDGWTPPKWCRDPGRSLAQPWYVAGSDFEVLKETADAESPAEFRAHGVYTSLGGLSVV
jgi:hypothetical protein